MTATLNESLIFSPDKIPSIGVGRHTMQWILATGHFTGFASGGPFQAASNPVEIEIVAASPGTNDSAPVSARPGAQPFIINDPTALAAFENALLFQPSKTVRATPAEVGLKYDTVVLQTSDHLKLAAWWVPADNARATVILSHGNGGNIGDRLAKLHILHDLGLNVLLYDYRGYGQSDGAPSVAGVYADAQAANDFVVAQKHIPAVQVVSYGESLGGAVAAHLAATNPVGALVLESSFTNVKDMAQVVAPTLAELVPPGLDTLSDLRQVKVPVLVLHSADDEIVPFAQGQRLFTAASEPKQFVRLTGTHNEGFLASGKTYTDGLNLFLTAHFAAPKTAGAK